MDAIHDNARSDWHSENSACTAFQSPTLLGVTYTNLENVTLRNNVEQGRADVTEQRSGFVTICNIAEHWLPSVTRRTLENVTMCNISSHQRAGRYTTNF